MKNILLLSLLLCLAIVLAACVKRMAPLSPHRANTEAHQVVKNNQECIECHAISEIGREHKSTDDCLRCHRIVQGD